MDNLYDLEEVEEVQNEEENDGVEIARYAITSYRTDRSIDNLIKWKKQGKLFVPKFQRDYVWKYKTCVKFIESILLGLPIPDIFVYKEINDAGERYQLIDGFQRISTIEDFKKGVWKPGTPMERKFKITNKQSKWYGRTYETLSQADKEYFDDYIFSLTIFDSAEKKEAKKKLYMTEVFERINTGSMKLSDQEVRNAVYSGTVIDDIKVIAEGSAFQFLTSRDKSVVDRKKNEEIILRFATYYLAYKCYIDNKNNFFDGADTSFTTSKNEMLSNFLFYSNKGFINYKDILTKISEALEYIKLFDAEAFYARSRDNTKISDKIHEILAESLVIATIELKEFSKNSVFFEELKEKIWSDEKEKETFTTATTSLDNVRKRVEYIKNRLK